MGSFVFIFRQGGRKLSEAEQERRTEEVRAWAVQQLTNDRNFDPRVLGDEGYQLEDDTPTRKREGTVIAFNFIEAKDLSEAVELAKTHPGLRYGVRIEVRPWTDPRAKPAAVA
jgi:hypothetical protein